MPDSTYRATCERITSLEQRRCLHFKRPLSLGISHDADEGVWVCASPDLGDLVTGQGDNPQQARLDFIRETFKAWDQGTIDSIATEH